MKPKREEQIKLEVAQQFFAAYDTTHILGNIDFSVAIPSAEGQRQLFETEYLLWAEAKRGTQHHLEHSLVQLIITIGKAHTYLDYLPPAFLGAFDEEKIAFLPYYRVADIFTTNDFDWKVAPSDHSSKEFAFVLSKVQGILQAETLVYHFNRDSKELHRFIRDNFVVGKSEVSKVRINKNNFTTIYQKWRIEVMPTIAVNWDEAKHQGVIDADFYLADILSEHNSTLLHRLYVLLRSDQYIFARRTDEATLFNSQLTAGFSDGQAAHHRFWLRYERPPQREYWDYIVERRDLLVPQDVRERRGSYFTPRRWVELSQQYLADELGDDWQDQYYIWDCCAGTGNLLAGLTNKYHIYASTLDPQDVGVIRERIANMGAGSNLLEQHVFQFDFLNDPFFDERDRKGRLLKKSKLPDSLQAILANPEERRRLVIYINPPYAEASNARQRTGTGANRPQLATETMIYDKYQSIIRTAARELFAQIFIRIYRELPGTTLAEFSTLKILQASNFREFRKAFQAQLGRNFIVPASSFDNVTGKFPIGFFIWHLGNSEQFKGTETNMYNAEGALIGKKQLVCYDYERLVIEWLRQFYDKQGKAIGYLRMLGTDMQNNNGVFITNKLSDNDYRKKLYTSITANNIVPMCIYWAIRHVITEEWHNDRDQFLYPNDGWQTDPEFQTDCLVHALFSNNVSATNGDNHWIPFTEEEVGARERFKSHLMADFLHGTPSEQSLPSQPTLFAGDTLPHPTAPLQSLSQEAKATMDAARTLYRYYHSTAPAADYNPDASFYDIRLHFQGTNEKGHMNPDSPDTTYSTLLATLRQASKHLAAHIAPKVYQYGFLR